MSVNPYEPPSLPPDAPPAPGTPEHRDAVKSLLYWPAVILIVLAALSAIAQGMALARPHIGNGANAADQSGDGLVNVLALFVNIATVIGAHRMMNLESYRSAMVAAVVSVIPICSPCIVLGIPFGIWAIVLLRRPDVKAAFTS